MGFVKGTKFSEEHKEKLRKAALSRNANRTYQIYELAVQGKSSKEIAAVVNTTSSNVNRILRKNGIKAVRGPNPKKGVSSNPKKIAEMRKMIEEGKSVREIAEFYNQNTSQIYITLKNQGIAYNKQDVWNANPEKIKSICDSYSNGKNTKDIAKEMDCSEGYIFRILFGAGLRDKTKIFKHRLDGYSTDKKGYVLTKLQPDDPMYCMCSKRGYVYVHRLVMARHLGRPLKETETVHHMNGIRDDYRLENLQLRQSNHGEGQVLKCFDCNSQNIISPFGWNQCALCSSIKIGFSEL
jgi:transposase